MLIIILYPISKFNSSFNNEFNKITVIEKYSIQIRTLWTTTKHRHPVSQIAYIVAPVYNHRSLSSNENRSFSSASSLRSNFPPFPRAARKKVSRFINGNNFAAWKGAFPRTVRIRCVDLFFPSFCARRNTLYPIRSGNCNIRRKQLHTARSRLEQSIGFRINGRCPGDKGGSIRAFGFSFQRGLRNVNRTSKILD